MKRILAAAGIFMSVLMLTACVSTSINDGNSLAEVGEEYTKTVAEYLDSAEKEILVSSIKVTPVVIIRLGCDVTDDEWAKYGMTAKNNGALSVEETELVNMAREECLANDLCIVMKNIDSNLNVDEDSAKYIRELSGLYVKVSNAELCYEDKEYEALSKLAGDLGKLFEKEFITYIYSSDDDRETLMEYSVAKLLASKHVIPNNSAVTDETLSNDLSRINEFAEKSGIKNNDNEYSDHLHKCKTAINGADVSEAQVALFKLFEYVLNKYKYPSPNNIINNGNAVEYLNFLNCYYTGNQGEKRKNLKLMAEEIKKYYLELKFSKDMKESELLVKTMKNFKIIKKRVKALSAYFIALKKLCSNNFSESIESQLILALKNVNRVNQLANGESPKIITEPQFKSVAALGRTAAGYAHNAIVMETINRDKDIIADAFMYIKKNLDKINKMFKNDLITNRAQMYQDEIYTVYINGDLDKPEVKKKWVESCVNYLKGTQAINGLKALNDATNEMRKTWCSIAKGELYAASECEINKCNGDDTAKNGSLYPASLETIIIELHEFRKLMQQIKGVHDSFAYNEENSNTGKK